MRDGRVLGGDESPLYQLDTIIEADGRNVALSKQRLPASVYSIPHGSR